ncbi:MAG: DUF1850 domain-containing protein [Nitrospinota bacterium]
MCVPCLPTLEVARVETRERLFRRYAPTGTTVEVRTYHSVGGGFITDDFETTEEALVLTASRFTAHGAGLPASYQPGENWRNGPDAFSLGGRRRVIRSILLRVSEKNENPLRVGKPTDNRQGESSPVLGPGLYEIGIYRRSLLSWALP